MELGTPRGMRDFLPGEMIARRKAFSAVRRVYESHGFCPMETPALESIPVLAAKCGEDVSKQIFRVQDSDLGLRFDLTVPLARVVASNASIPKPFKRYCIARVWRREEPQKGRFREFWQADADIVGSASKRCEAELLSAAAEALCALGFSGVKIRLNSRKALDAAIERSGIPREQAATVLRSLDKLEKIGEEAVARELKEKGIPDAGAAKLLSFGKINGGYPRVAASDPVFISAKNTGALEEAEKFLSGAQGAREALAELSEVCANYALYAVSSRVPAEIDFSLVRGLDYYTGPVFEFAAGGGLVGSVGGGGRYDGLIGLYGSQQVPAVGVSLGIERILALTGAGQQAAKGVCSIADVLVAPVKPEHYPYAVKVLDELRSAGVNSEIDVMARNLKKQLESANSQGTRFVAIVGEREKSETKVTLRDLETGQESMVTVPEAAKLAGAVI
jgi:histidyl-tRNA synthetase